MPGQNALHLNIDFVPIIAMLKDKEEEESALDQPPSPKGTFLALHLAIVAEGHVTSQRLFVRLRRPLIHILTAPRMAVQSTI